MNFEELGLAAGVLSLSDIDEIIQFEEARQPKTTEAMIHSWNAPWRREALEHYLPLGWSFYLKDKNILKGYFLAQPLLFYRGATQTLWLEHLSGWDERVSLALLDLARRVAREKHLQSVLFESVGIDPTSLGGVALTSTLYQIRTTKMG